MRQNRCKLQSARRPAHAVCWARSTDPSNQFRRRGPRTKAKVSEFAAGRNVRVDNVQQDVRERGRWPPAVEVGESLAQAEGPPGKRRHVEAPRGPRGRERHGPVEEPLLVEKEPPCLL